MIVLPDAETRMIVSLSILAKHRNVTTDRRTDGQAARAITASALPVMRTRCEK